MIVDMRDIVRLVLDMYDGIRHENLCIGEDGRLYKLVSTIEPVGGDRPPVQVERDLPERS